MLRAGRRSNLLPRDSIARERCRTLGHLKLAGGYPGGHPGGYPGWGAALTTDHSPPRCGHGHGPRRSLGASHRKGDIQAKVANKDTVSPTDHYSKHKLEAAHALCRHREAEDPAHCVRIFLNGDSTYEIVIMYIVIPSYASRYHFWC